MDLLPLWIGVFIVGLLSLFYGPVPVRAWLESTRWERERRVVARENQSPVQLAIILAPIGAATLGFFGAVVADGMGVDGVIVPVAQVLLPLLVLPVLGIGLFLQVAPFARRTLVYRDDGVSLYEGGREVARQPVLNADTLRLGTRMGSHQVAVRMPLAEGTRWVVLRGPGVKVHWRVDHPVEVDDPVRVYVNAGILPMRRLLSARLQGARSEADEEMATPPGDAARTTPPTQREAR